jgi:acyl-CoA hydrolase/GNAT superfamily N-acetyltransferase
MVNLRWPDEYLQKRTSVQKAIQRIQSGQRVFMGTASGEPPCLAKELVAQASRFADLEIIGLFCQGFSPFTLIARKSGCDCFNIRSFYQGSVETRTLAKNKRFITPINLSAVPRLLKSRQIPVHVALIQVSPPDDFGWMSLGVSVDITLAGAQSADLVIAQVNNRMPRVLGSSFLHVDDVHLIVECEEDLLTITDPPDSEASRKIAEHVVKLIDDGSTIQISLGAAPRATIQALADRQDLGIHTRYLTDAIMQLTAQGVITNRKKGLHEGKLVASSAIGSKDLYAFIHENPGIEFYPSDYVNNPGIIARNNKMVALNVAMAMDLTGQVAADALPYNNFSGVTSMMDFIRGAADAPGGKSILMLPSTTLDGKKSRIVPFLENIAVVVPRGDVHYVVTEYGIVNLFGKSLQERAMALISIAHPDFREELFYQAKKIGLLGPERKLSESLFGIYPLKVEETREVNGKRVFLRPVKPTDERLIQEHFYTMDKDDVISRFMHEKLLFSRHDLADVYQVDYVRNMTIVAVVGEVGVERIASVGAYFIEPARNTAEVAISVLRDWQGLGLGSLLIRKLADAARENGISGLTAYTQPNNHRMIKLFQSLPYKVNTTFDGDLLSLSCKFDEPT